MVTLPEELIKWCYVYTGVLQIVQLIAESVIPPSLPSFAGVDCGTTFYINGRPISGICSGVQRAFIANHEMGFII